MNYLTCLFSFLLLSSAFAQFKIYLETNSSDSISRNSDLKKADDGLYFYSIAVQNKPEDNTDACFGAAITSHGSLESYLAYFNQTIDWASSDGGDLDTSKAAVMIGAAYLGLSEVDPNNGTVLSQVLMKDLTWTASDVQTLGGVKYATFSGSDSNNANFSISFTFVITNDIERITTGAQLDPKGVEAIINILNYQFASETSSLILAVGVATATVGDAQDLEDTHGMQQLAAGDDTAGVYWTGGKSVLVDINGTHHDVTVTSMVANASDMNGAGFVEQCTDLQQAKNYLNLHYYRINISFPQSNNLTYDPSIGVNANGDTGKDNNLDGNTATTSQPQAAIFFGLLVALGAMKFL